MNALFLKHDARKHQLIPCFRNKAIRLHPVLYHFKRTISYLGVKRAILGDGALSGTGKGTHDHRRVSYVFSRARSASVFARFHADSLHLAGFHADSLHLAVRRLDRVRNDYSALSRPISEYQSCFSGESRNGLQ